MVYLPLCWSWHSSSYLIVNSVVSYPTPLQRERDGVGKISSIGWEHLHLSNFQNPLFLLCKHKYTEGGGKGWELTLCLWVDISSNMGLGIGQPHAWAGFNHHKMTINLGSVGKLHKSPTQMGSLMLLTDNSNGEFLKKTKLFSGFKNPYKNLQNKNTRIYSWIAFCRMKWWG
jgi:hypothetical protein